MTTFVLRMWLPDRPGALGAVASRIGAVGGDLVGIEILERGAGRAIDELVVELPDGDFDEAERLRLLAKEITQVDGVAIEDIRPMAEALRDPRLDALETAAILVGASTPGGAIDELCVHAVRTIGATWGVVASLDEVMIEAEVGEAPDAAWLVAFVAGSQSSARVASGSVGPEDVSWAPLPSARMALILGRRGAPFRARERRQAAALARIVDTRFRELRAISPRLSHPSGHL